MSPSAKTPPEIHKQIPLQEIPPPNTKFAIKYLEAPKVDHVSDVACSDDFKIKLKAKTQSTQTRISAQYLPKDILLKIFNYIPMSSLVNCIQVCKNWSNVM